MARALPVSPVRGRHLQKLDLPLASRLYPHSAEVLISRRRPLILTRWHTQNNVVSDDGNRIASRNNLHLVRHHIRAASTELIKHFLSAVKLRIVGHEREIIGQLPFEKVDVAFFQGREKTFLLVHQGLFQRSCWISRRNLPVSSES